MTRSTSETTPDEALARGFAVVAAEGTTGPHPGEDDWVRLAANELDATERTRLARHVTACAECAAVLRVVSELQAAAPGVDAAAPRVGAAAPPAAPASASFPWRWLAAAAVLALVAGSTLWRQWPGTTGGAPPVAVAVTADAVPPPTDAPGVPVAPALRAFAALGPAPAVMLPASMTLVVRGTPAAADPFMTAFAPAIALYRQGRHGDAAAALDEVTRRFPGVPEGWFYLGVSRLYAQRPDAAVTPLRRAQMSTVVGADARWLEAVALERAGRAAEATRVLDRLCGEAGTLQARACAATR